MPNARDSFYQLVQSRLQAKTGQTISEFILSRREPDGGKEAPYRRIASELVDVTGVDLTHEAARRWYHRAVEDRAAAEEDRANEAIREAQARQQRDAD
jgi:hypothetical protein